MNYQPPAILVEASASANRAQPRIGTSPEKPIRVVAVDDHPAVRAALVDTIQAQRDLSLCGVAAGPEDAIRLVQRERPDVAVVDISLGDVSGIDLIERLRQVRPGLRVVIFSMYDEAAYIDRAIRAGASGYVTKSESTARVAEAIRTVASGQEYFSRTPGTNRQGAGQAEV